MDTRPTGPTIVRHILLAVFAAALGLATGCSTLDDTMQKTNAATLEGVRWTVSDIGSTAVAADASQTTPHISLDAEDRRLTGHGGVNSLGGSFETRKDHRLSFGPVFSTRRAGPPEQMGLEVALLQALEATRSYRISGQSLELLDASGNTVARFMAAPAP